MAGRSTTVAFVSSSGTVSDPRETGAAGRMVKPRTAGTTAPEDRGRAARATTQGPGWAV